MTAALLAPGGLGGQTLSAGVAAGPALAGRLGVIGLGQLQFDLRPAVLQLDARVVDTQLGGFPDHTARAILGGVTAGIPVWRSRAGTRLTLLAAVGGGRDLHEMGELLAVGGLVALERPGHPPVFVAARAVV